MALWASLAGLHVLQGASGSNLSMTGASKTKSFYTNKEGFCYSSNSSELTGSHTWSIPNAATFPLLSHTQSVQYDPVSDTFVRNNNGQIAEYDSTHTLRRSMNITSIPHFNSLDGVFTSLSGEPYIYYLVKSSGELYRLNRDLTGTPVFVTTISPLEYATPYAVGGFYHQDYLYVMNNNGTQLLEISIQTGKPVRSAVYTQKGTRSVFPMVCYAAGQSVGVTHYFTLCDMNGANFTMYAVKLANVNPSAPYIEGPDGTPTTPGIHDIETMLRWTFFDSDTGDRQSAYQIEITEVASDTVIYDSGKVKGQSNSFYTYAISLKIHELYKWRVRVWDYYDAISPWSRYAFFKTNQRPSIVLLSGKAGDTAHLPVLGLTPRLYFRYTDPDSDPIRELYIKIYNTKTAKQVLYQRISPVPNEQYFVVPVGILEPGTTYWWSLNGFDSYGSAFFSSSCSFITTASANPPLPITPVHHERTSGQPFLEAELDNEPGGIPQHFQLELSDLPDFSLAKTFRTDEDQAGWEAYNGKEWVPFPPTGVRRRTQFVYNASFEQADSMNKFYYDWTATGVTTEDTVDLNAPPHTGNRALRIIQKSPVLSELKLSQELHRVQPGERLRVTAVLHVVRMAQGAEIRIELNGMNFTHKGKAITDRTSSYQMFTFDFTVPANYSSFLQIDFAMKGAGYTECWLDALTVEATDHPSYQRIRFKPAESLPSKAWYWRIASYHAMTKSDPKYYSSEPKLQTLLPLMYSDNGQVGSNSIWGFEVTGSSNDYSLNVVASDHPDGIPAIHAINRVPNADLALFRVYEGEMKPGKYYLLIADMKSTHPDCYIQFAEYRSAKLQKPDTWETLWFTMPGVNPFYDFIKFYISPKAKGQHTYIAKPRIYEISEMEYERIGIDPLWSGPNLNILYPFSNFPFTLFRQSSFRVGDELAVSLKKPVLTTAAASKFTMNVVRAVPSDRVMNRIPGTNGTIQHTGYPTARDESIIFVNQPYIYVHLTFTGTGIRWYGQKSTDGAIAYVMIDYRFVAQVDQYAAEPVSNELLFECLDLPYGEHTITLKASAYAHPASNGQRNLTITAFETITVQTPATLVVEACNNGFDELPSWEDVTAIVETGGNHTFVNQSKTSRDWAVGVRMKISANGTYSPVMLDGFGFSFE